MKPIIIRICFLLLICSAGYGQQTHFIYLQTESRDPFYVLLNKKNYSSSSIGYLILPKLTNGDYDMYVGFPKKDGAEQVFSIRVKDNDQGFLLKDFGDKGLGIFNLQSLAIQYAGEARQKATALAAAEAKKVADELAKKTADSLVVVEARQKAEALAAAELKLKADEAAKKTADSLAVVEAKQQAEILAAAELKRKADELAAKQVQDSIAALATQHLEIAAAEIKRKSDEIALKRQKDSIAVTEAAQQKLALAAAEQEKKIAALALKKQKDSIATAEAQQQKAALAAADLKKKADALALKRQKDSIAAEALQQQKDALATADQKKKADALALKQQKDSISAATAQQGKDTLATADQKKKADALALKQQKDSIAAATTQEQKEALATAEQKKNEAALALKKQQDALAAEKAEDQKDAIAAANLKKKTDSLALQNGKDSIAAAEAAQKQEALQAAEARRKAEEMALLVTRDSVRKAAAFAAEQKMQDSLKTTSVAHTVSPNEITLSTKAEKVTIVAVPKNATPALFHSGTTDSGFVYKYVLAHGGLHDTVSVFIKGNPPVKKKPGPVASELPAMPEKIASPTSNNNGVKFLDMNFNQDSGLVTKDVDKLPSSDKTPTKSKPAEAVKKPAKDSSTAAVHIENPVVTTPPGSEAAAKMAIVPNSNCKATANDKDFFSLRKKMAAQETPDDMISAARKGMKEKCYTSSQVRNLSVLFLNDAERYQFLDAAYPFALDAENYGSLADLLIDPYYKERFRVMIRK